MGVGWWFVGGFVVLGLSFSFLSPVSLVPFILCFGVRWLGHGAHSMDRYMYTRLWEKRSG
jgi:hypothetical protein